ncbi:hypothetical protein F4677DRAFT_337348 [Hypoxylon crocopeplum]|nr:hypothetical protein F4677DRAFT_337348 [Hypoxylon crocopeplum]
MPRLSALLAIASLATSTAAQNTSAGGECLSAVSSLYAQVPTPSDSDLATFVQTFAASNPPVLLTNPCAVVTAIPTSLASQAVSYQSQISSFLAAHASAVGDVVAQCAGTSIPDLDPTSVTAAAAVSNPEQFGFFKRLLMQGQGKENERRDLKARVMPTAGAGTDCFAALAAAAAAESSSAPDEPDACDAPTSTTATTVSTSAARPTGVVAGAAAVVGLMGAVVLL